jgi:cell wall-associated protease
MQVFADAPDHCRPVTDITLTSNLLSPQPVGTTILWTAVVTGGTAPEFRFWVQAQGGPFILAQDYGPSSTFIWRPSVEGAYVVCVWVRRTGSPADKETDTCAQFRAERRVSP